MCSHEIQTDSAARYLCFIILQIQNLDSSGSYIIDLIVKLSLIDVCYQPLSPTAPQNEALFFCM